MRSRHLFPRKKNLAQSPAAALALPKLNVIPVNQEAIDRSALKALIRVLKAGNGALVFPEGARTLDGDLQPALPGIGLLIAKTLAPVVPMRIFGAHEALPVAGAVYICIRLQSLWANRFILRKPIFIHERAFTRA